uniref:URB1 ribosome biogenesis homolog n=1 Tax=Cynoglossus semilaevis TaxID=244447 RepID=A0A3P8W600_CYNSE
MGKKRSNEDLASDTSAKKEKLEEFNGTMFKTMLKEGTTVRKGLETFISVAKKLPCPDLYDVVEGYIKISMECAEMFKLLDVEKHNESETVLVLESLEMILLRTASDLSHFNMVGNAIVKKIVSSYMKPLQGFLHSQNHRFVRQCLSLLSAMVAQGPAAAREVFSQIHINRSLSGLAKRKDKRVVLNKVLSKTQKVRFFTPPVLANIASLYKWNGVVDQAAVSVIRELVHSFLLDLCCSRKHGISFHDASYGTAGRAGNIVLLQFLVGLKQATEDELVAELVVNALKANPDILARYLKETQYSYTPRLKSAWQDNVRLLKKIYQVQPEISAVFQTGDVIPIPRLLSMIMVISLPPVCNKAFFTQGLSVTVQLTTLSMMSFVLKKAHMNIEYLVDKESQNSDVYTDDEMADLVQQYREALTKILPDMTSIVAKWQSLSKKDKKAGEEKTVQADDIADTAEVILLKALILQVICLYQKVVPHLVNQCKFDFSKLLKGNASICFLFCFLRFYNFCWIVTEKGMRQEVPPVLQYQILQLALELPSSKFSWFRIQDTGDTESTEKSVLYLLLKMFVSSTNNHLKASTQMLVLKVLKDSGVFEYTWTELELWLAQLLKVAPDQQETVIRFLERVLGKLVCSSSTYTDKVASYVQEAAYLQSNLCNQEGEAASIPVSHIDDVIDMLDVIMDGNDGQMEEFGPSLNEDLIIQTFPFSALVPAALEARNKLPSNIGVTHEYLCAVLCDVLHCQREPLPLCLALLQYDKELLSSDPSASPHPAVHHLHQYYNKWLPHLFLQFTTSICDSETPLPPTSYSALMKAAYSQGTKAFLEDTFVKNVDEALTSMSMDEFPVAIKQILLYIKSTVENFGMVRLVKYQIRTVKKIEFASQMKHNVVFKLKCLHRIRVCVSCSSCGTESTENLQEGSDLFLEINQSSAVETDKERILVTVLESVFKHPCLEQWFLALELSSLPPHTLKPVRLKKLCAQLTDDILALLKVSAPILQDLSHLQPLCSYTGTLERALLKEFSEQSQDINTQSRPLQGLLSLHSYMDSSLLREVVSRLLLLPRERLLSPATKGTHVKLSVYGHAALQILTEHGANPSQDHGTFLTKAHLSGLSTLLFSCTSPALESFMLQVLTTEPGSAKLIHTDVLLHCLQRPVADCLTIGSLLLRNSPAHRLRFELWCSEPANIKKVSEETDIFIPLINTYLQMAGRDDGARPKNVQNNVLKSLKKALLAKVSQCVLRTLTEESGDQFAQTLVSLVQLSCLHESFNVLFSFRWQLVEVISEKLADFPDELENWRTSVTAAAFRCLITSYSQSKDQTQTLSEQELGILGRLPTFLVSIFYVKATEWNSFVKNGLKYRYRDHHFLNTLSTLLNLMYGDIEVSKDLLSLSTLHMMTTSHSLFLPTMLEEEPSRSQAKEALVSLLLCLVRKCPTVCSSSHFVIFLGAYGATLNISDQTLLLLLQEYEKNQVSLLKFQSYLWGPAAVEHHKTRTSLGASLWKQASPDDILALLNPEQMLQTIAHFPQHRRLIPQVNIYIFKSNIDADALKDIGHFYDPCFLLPLFSAILQPECVVDCFKFVSSHALGFTVMALSSYDTKLRAAAYHVLGCFYHHLEGARFREKRQLLYLMDMVKNGIQKENLRLPFVMTTYIQKVAQLMLKPEDHMYVVLNRFLLSHQSLDFKRVPEFFKLFYGFETEHKVDREWILSVLEEGIADRHCFEQCDRQAIFQSLLGLSSSPLRDENSQAQIIRVLCKAATVNKAAYNLTKTCGILTWMIQMIEKRDPHLLSSLIDLLHVLWFTNLGQKEKQVDEVQSSAEEKPKNLIKCLPLPLINEFLCVALEFTKYLRLGLKAASLSRFLQTLCFVLKHRGTALSVNKQAERFSLLPQPLSCAEVLAPLLCWASLSGDKALTNQIHCLSEKSKTKEMLGSNLKPSIHRKDLEEDPETKKGEDISLTECKYYLSAIFIHWEPVFPLSEPPQVQPGDRVALGQLACDTAHLLTKWSLRFLVESPYDEKRTEDLLHWVEKYLMKHQAIVDVLLLDPGLKADLLRLYHQAFESQNVSRNVNRFKTLQQFTKIMMRLLDSQGQLPEVHQAVVSTCLPGDTNDLSRCGKTGLYLLSLYIHELWSEATSAELFLSHVHLVNKTMCAKRKSPKTQPSALTAICSDIIAWKTS